MDTIDTAERADPVPNNQDQLVLINRFFLFFIILGLAAAGLCASDLRQIPSAVLWALACLAVGAFVGLLFGIPRMRQKAGPKGEEKESEPRYQAEVNNNLIEVSDWLTKIIVGVGLVQLESLPGKLKLVAGPLARCLGEHCGLAAAVGIIVFFTSIGFLAGYINARTFVAVMFRKSDDQLLAEVSHLKSQLKQTAAVQQAQQVESAVKNEGIRELLASQGVALAAAPDAAPTPPAEPDPEFVSMAQAYRTIDHPDYSVRVHRKEQAASQMLRHLIKNRTSRADLYRWVQAMPADGMIIALASLVITAPVEGDLAVLKAVAGKAEWLHVKYRVTLAFSTLFRAGFGSPEDWAAVRDIMLEYQKHARQRRDDSLLSVAGEILSMIKAKYPAI